MSREWQPGDVAIATHLAPTTLGIVRVRGESGGLRLLEVAYSSGGFDIIEDLEPGDLRPLVVIDPEDREAVGRFRDLLDPKATHFALAEYQHALREFADPKPPKPDEPTGPLSDDELRAVRALIAEREL